jgi:ribosome-binding ATPase YchF (GTP1/OBG family)
LNNTSLNNTAVNVLSLSSWVGEKHEDQTKHEFQAALGVSEVAVTTVHSVEEYQRLALTGVFQHGYIAWAHVPEMQAMRQWTIENDMRAWKAEYVEERVRTSYRGSRSFKNEMRRLGVKEIIFTPTA